MFHSEAVNRCPEQVARLRKLAPCLVHLRGHFLFKVTCSEPHLTCFEEGVLPPAKAIRKIWRLQRKGTAVGGFSFLLFINMRLWTQIWQDILAYINIVQLNARASSQRGSPRASATDQTRAGDLSPGRFFYLSSQRTEEAESIVHIMAGVSDALFRLEMWADAM